MKTKVKNGDKIIAIIKPLFNKAYKEKTVRGTYIKFGERHLIAYNDNGIKRVSQIELKDLIN